jgi:dolichol-phosphate mannosyltransferase
VLGLPIHDTKSGFKAYRREVLERLNLRALRSRGFIFQAEVLYRCHKLGFGIREVPFVFHDRNAGSSKMSLSIIVEALWRSLWLRVSRG